MSTAAAAVLFATAGLLGLLAGLIYRGHTSLISGHRRGELGDAAEDALGRWFGVRLLPLCGATAGLGVLELGGGSPDWAWLGYTVVAFVTVGWLVVGGRRFDTRENRRP